MGYYPRSYFSFYGGLHIIESITLDGLTTAAIELTSIIDIITIATKVRGRCEG